MKRQNEQDGQDEGKAGRQRLALARKYLREENRKWPVFTLREMPADAWPKADVGPTGATVRIWAGRSRDFLVQVFAEGGTLIRISVNRTEINSGGDWVDGITWDDLQRLKRQAGYGDFQAVEIYPPDGDVVNVANMRHLWILPVPVACAWKNGQDSQDGQDRGMAL